MSSSTSNPKPTEISLPIEGMSCASCVNRIERFLSKTPGVEDASVNLATEMATIRYRPDIADRAALVQAIESAGYDVRRRAAETPDESLAANAQSAALSEAFTADDAARARESRALLLEASVSVATA